MVQGSSRTSCDPGNGPKEDIDVSTDGGNDSSLGDVEHQQCRPSGGEKARDEPPDGGYGWVCVACCFWINAHTWGINSVSGSRPSPNMWS